MAIIDLNTQFGAYPARHRASTYDMLLAEFGAAGVTSGCTCSTVGIYFNDREGNLDTLAAAASAPGKLIPVAVLNPATALDPAATIAEIASGPFRMVRFFPAEQDWPTDFAPFTQSLKALATTSLPVMVSASRRGDATQIARAANAAGSLRAIVLEGASRDTLAECIAAMRDCPALVLETHALAASDSLPAIRDLVGIERIVFGSGASAMSIGAALSYVNGSSLSQSEKALVLGGNAERILG